MKARANLHVHYSAGLYDKYSERYLALYDQLLLRRMKEEFDPVAQSLSRVILDVGTGTGRFLNRIRGNRQYDEFTVVGLDYFGDMIEIAEANFRHLSSSTRPHFLVGDAHALPFHDESVGLIISRSTIHHWADPVAALREMYRVLCLGGIALIHDVRRDPPPSALKEFNRQRALAGVEPCRLEEKYTPAELEHFVRQADLLEQGDITVRANGLASLGMELLITKTECSQSPR